MNIDITPLTISEMMALPASYTLVSLYHIGGSLPYKSDYVPSLEIISSPIIFCAFWPSGVPKFVTSSVTA